MAEIAQYVTEVRFPRGQCCYAYSFCSAGSRIAVSSCRPCDRGPLEQCVPAALVSGFSVSCVSHTTVQTKFSKSLGPFRCSWNVTAGCSFSARLRLGTGVRVIPKASDRTTNAANYPYVYVLVFNSLAKRIVRTFLCGACCR